MGGETNLSMQILKLAKPDAERMGMIERICAADTLAYMCKLVEQLFYLPVQVKTTICGHDWENG